MQGDGIAPGSELSANLAIAAEAGTNHSESFRWEYTRILVSTAVTALHDPHRSTAGYPPGESPTVRGCRYPHQMNHREV